MSVRVPILLALLALAPRSGSAQHDPRESLLAPSAGDEAMLCRRAERRHPQLPASAITLEFTFGPVERPASSATPRVLAHRKYSLVWDSAGTLVAVTAAHLPMPGDTIEVALLAFVGASGPLEGQWLASRPTPSFAMEPLTPAELVRIAELGSHLWARRCDRAPRPA